MSLFRSNALLGESVGIGLLPDPPNPVYLGLRLSSWIKIGTVAILMSVLFWTNLVRLWYKTNPFTGEANWGHAICIPLIGLYYLYTNREQLRAAPARPAWAGAFILVAGILLFGYGIYPGQNDFVKDFGMVVTLFGVVTLLAGWAVMRIAWFPIVFLICGIPWPQLVYGWVAGPLQHLAAKVAVHTLQLTGVSAGNVGTKILIDGANGTRVLNVAEACAGLRSLMTFVSIAAAVAFLSARPLWEKLVIVVSAIPIAIGCNVMRVAGQGLLDHYWSPELSESFAHQFVGMVMLTPAFFLILLVGWILDRLFIDVIDDKAALAAARKPAVLSRAVGVPVPAAAAASAAPVRPRVSPPPPTRGNSTRLVRKPLDRPGPPKEGG